MSDISTAVSRVRFGEMCEQSHTRWIQREHLDGDDAGVVERLEPPQHSDPHGVKRPTAGLACSTLPVRKASFPLELLSGTSETQVGHNETTARTGSPYSAAPRQASGNWRIRGLGMR